MKPAIIIIHAISELLELLDSTAGTLIICLLWDLSKFTMLKSFFMANNKNGCR